MSMLLERNVRMGTPFLREFKRQASFFLKEKIKTARLALTDVTPAQLLTEEATNGDFWAPDTRTLVVISRAAFEVDDYWRIVDILHKKLTKFDRKAWRVSYKSLLVLEHLLTHGPLRVVDEFESDKEVIKEIGSFQFIDDKGFNWGLSVRNLSARTLKLLENELYLREERAKSRKLTRGIQGFGSFTHRLPSDDHESFRNLASRSCTRCNSDCNDQYHQEYEFLPSEDHFSIEKFIKEPQKLYEDITTALGNSGMIKEEEYMKDHPFYYSDLDAKETLLSAI